MRKTSNYKTEKEKEKEWGGEKRAGRAISKLPSR